MLAGSRFPAGSRSPGITEGKDPLWLRQKCSSTVSRSIMAEVGGKGKTKSGFVTTFFGFTTEAQSPQSTPSTRFSLRALAAPVVSSVICQPLRRSVEAAGAYTLPAASISYKGDSHRANVDGKIGNR